MGYIQGVDLPFNSLCIGQLFRLDSTKVINMAGIIRNSLQKIVPSVRSQVPTKNITHIHGPPQEHIQKMEKFALLSFMVLGTVLPMGWIMCNLNYYTGAKTKDGWTAPTFVGSDGRVYYAKPEDA